MDYEHDDRRAADVPGANGAEGSGVPAGREPNDTGSPSFRADDDLFDAMFLTGGMRPPAFAAVDHDLGFPPPQGPDLASHFLAALDAIDDRRFVTPVPDDQPPAAPAPTAPVAHVETAASGEPAYELRPQSRLELESEKTPEPVDETSAEPVVAEGAERLPWETGRIPVAGLLTTGESEPTPAPEPTESANAVEDTWAFASYLESESEPRVSATAAEPALETASAAEATEAAEAAEAAEATEAAGAAEAAEDVEEFATAEDAELDEPIEEAAYYAAGLDGDAGDSDEAEAAATIAAEADAEAEEIAAAAAQAEAEAEEAAAAARAEADAEAEALARAIAEAEQAELEAAIAAEAALDESSDSASSEADEAFAESDIPSTASAFATSFDASDDASDEAALDASSEASLDASLEDDAFDTAFDAPAFGETLDAEETLDVTPDAVGAVAGAAESAAPLDTYADADFDVDVDLDLTPADDDLELEPSIGMNPIDAAPMAFDGPDAFAAAPVSAAEPEPEPENESDELEDLQDFVVFSLGDMRCVVPIRNVVEVGRIPDAAPVPNAPAWLYGLGNLRGQVLSLIDLRALFGVGRIKASAGRMVVLRGDEDDITAGVMVDQVHQIVALSPSRFKEAPAQLPLPEKSTEYVRGACDYGNYTMIGLDVDGVLGVESMTEETVV